MAENNESSDKKYEDVDYVSEIFKNAQRDDENTEGDDLFADTSKQKKKRTILLSSGVALLVAAGAAVMFWEPITDTLNFNTDRSAVEGDVITQEDEASAEEWDNIEDSEYDGPDESFAQQEGKEFPIKVEDWQVEGRSFIEDKNTLREHHLGYAEAIHLSTDANVLPQEAAGFTSDESQQTLEDGTLNPMYSYWTAEVFQTQTADILERLLNPVYGEWGLYQYAEYKPNSQFAIENLEDIFTTAWLTENSGKSYGEYVPVYADWNENNYGLEDTLLVSGNRWIGSVDNLTTEFEYDMDTQQYVVDLTADVTFSAWTNDEDTLERTGTLTLELVSNAQEANSNSDYKVLVNNASLTVDGE